MQCDCESKIGLGRCPRITRFLVIKVKDPRHQQSDMTGHHLAISSIPCGLTRGLTRAQHRWKNYKRVGSVQRNERRTGSPVVRPACMGSGMKNFQNRLESKRARSNDSAHNWRRVSRSPFSLLPGELAGACVFTFRPIASRSHLVTLSFSKSDCSYRSESGFSRTFFWSAMRLYIGPILLYTGSPATVDFCWSGSLAICS